VKRVLHSLALVAAVALGSSACRGPEPQLELSAEEPELRPLTLKDHRSGAVIRRWSVLVYPDGRQLKHGKDRRWYPSGSRLSEEEFDHGEQVGELRRWYRNGRRQSEASFDPEGGLTPMSFWHENGQLAARGQGRRGRREGYWEHWYPGGDPRERGGYIDGTRSGLWILFYEDGSTRSIGRFQEGERVGPWRHFEPGERFEADSDA